MARQLRIEYEGAFYHVTSRGNQRTQIFWDNKDRTEFKRILERTKGRYGYVVHGYVLMDNHYHLLIETPYGNLRQIMQNINTSYTVFVNRRYKRAGHLFQGRYKAFIIDKESYLLALGRYIHLNPVRAGIVKKPEHYQWSSYRDYISVPRKEKITDTDDMLSSFSKSRAIARSAYGAFVNDGIQGTTSPLEFAVGSILGNESFRGRVLRYLKGIPDKTEIPEIKRIEPKHEIRDIVRVVAEYYSIEESGLLKRKKASERQRSIAIYLCKILSGKKNAEIGKIFGITLQGVTNTLRRIEKVVAKDRRLSREMGEIKVIAEGLK
jgi:putative transposase